MTINQRTPQRGSATKTIQKIGCLTDIVRTGFNKSKIFSNIICFNFDLPNIESQAQVL